VLKLFIKIFLVYLLLLAVLPCVDNCATSTCTAEKIVHIEETSSQIALCPPFCNCFCCNSIVSIKNNFTLSISVNSTFHFVAQTFEITPYNLKPTSPPPKA